jgi:nucleotide-binding universal stress UspA family protein
LVDIFPSKILLATDGSEDAAVAAWAAADLSSMTHSELHVVHAWRSLPHYAYPSLVPESYHPPYEEGARKILDRQVEQVREAGGAVAEAHLRTGSPTDAILDVVEEVKPGLLIAGSRDLGPIKHLLLGSVSEALVHHAACPVLVVRGGKRAWPPGRIVVGDDGSESARQAGQLAGVMGALLGVRMLLVRVQPKPPKPPDLPDYEEGLHDRVVREDQQRGIKDLEERSAMLSEALGERPEVRLVIDDEATAAILAASDEAISTLVAVGSRGLGPIGRARLGSVSTKVLRTARGPVLVCPPFQNEDERWA